MMRVVLLLLTLQALACSPPKNPTAGMVITGRGAQELTPVEHAGIFERAARAVECGKAEGFEPKHRLEEVRVRSTCWFWRARRWVQGYGINGRAEVGISQGDLEHEVLNAVYFHAPHPERGQPESTWHPLIRCAEDIKRAWFADHERRKCEPRPED